MMRATLTGKTAISSSGTETIFKSVVRQPLLRHHPDKAFDVTTDVSVLYKADGQHVQLLMDEAVLRGAVYPVKLDPSFEIYTEKIPDSSVYSEFDTNAYLRHYEVVGHHPALGEGWTYVRFRLNTYFHAAPADILSAEYCVRELSRPGRSKPPFISRFISGTAKVSFGRTGFQRTNGYRPRAGHKPPSARMI